VAAALSGDADENEDQVISLDELYGYVQPNVSAWVDAATAKNESQTPLLVNCQASEDAAADVKLLSTNGLSALADMDAGLALGEAGAGLMASASDELMSTAPPQAGELLAQRGGDASGDDAFAETSGSEGQASASTSAADGQAKPAGTSSPESSASTEGLEFRRQASHELAKAWKAAAELTSSDKTLSPIIYAPSVWRELVDRLLWFEHFCAADFSANQESIWRTAVDELQSMNRSFEQFNSDAEIPAGGNLVDELRRARTLLRPPMQVADEAPPRVSLALIEYAAEQDRSRRFPAKVQKLLKFARDYDALMLTGKDVMPDELNALLTAKEQVDAAELANFYEFQILDLRSDADVRWPLASLALRVRRLGEKVSADLLCGEGWGRAAVDVGDRARWEGERLLRDRTDRDWEKLANERLQEAQNRYKQAAEELSEVRGAKVARSELLTRLPDYFRWAYFSRADGAENSPKPEKFRNLFAALDEADKVLSQPGNDLTNLRRARRQLEEARGLLDQGLNDASEPWRLSAILLTALPDFQKRGQLRADLAKADASYMVDFPRQDVNSAAFEVRPLDDRRWSAANSQFEVDRELARQAGFSQTRETTITVGDDESKSEASGALYEMDENYHHLFATSIESHDVQQVENATTRSDALIKLRGDIRGWLLQDAQQELSSDPETGNLFSLLNSSAWYDLLVWQSMRTEQAIDDASPGEAERLRKSVAEYRTLAESIDGQPDLPSSTKSQLTLTTTSEVSLVTQNEAIVNVKVQSPSAADIWLIAEYDGRLLEVQGPGVVSQEELRRKAAAANRTRSSSQPAMYPYRPDDLGAAKTTLAAGSARDVPITVRRLTNEHGDTKLILKAVSKDAYLRQEMQVELPGNELFQLTVRALNGLWEPTNDGVALHPLPNRSDDFVFMLANRAKVKKTVGVSLIVPDRMPPPDRLIDMPRGAVRAEAAAEFLKDYGGGTLMPPLTVELPASGDAVPVKFTSAADQKPPAVPNLLISDPAEAEKFAGKDLPYGFIVVIDDPETKRQTLRRVQIQPQPPRNYLSALAQLDATGGLTIQVSATNRALVPAEGIKIRGKIEGISAQLESQLSGVIRGPTYTATLTGKVPPNVTDMVKATIDVDGYPRAFIFEIPPQATSRAFEPKKDARAVRITSPERHKAFKAPNAVVPVVMEVDAPHNTFSEGSNAIVAVGIDSDRDGELSDENAPPPRIMRSDRQVRVAATSFVLDGTLTLDTKISDFHLQLTSDSGEEYAWVLGQLWAPPLEATSEPVEIKLDRVGPVFDEIRVPSEAEAGKDLNVEIIASDLSQVVKVEATFETLASGNSEEEKPSWTAAQSDNGARWIAKLKTDKVFPGTSQLVLVRATDEVDHVTTERSHEVRIVDKPAEQKPGQQRQRKRTTVSGRVTFNGEPLTEATVQFDPPLSPPIPPVKTDDSGQFVFRNVPPGKHNLWARGQTKGYFRNAKMEIEVPEDANKPVSVTLIAK
jgi:hypothetical protein